jgi:hypothetical protein
VVVVVGVVVMADIVGVVADKV